MDFTTRSATLADLTYIDHLQRKNAEELAFFPKQVFEREVENQRIILAELNSEPCGYVYHGAFGVICRIHQACIQYDLRGQLYGAALVRDLTTRCQSFETATIKLRCGSDIEANKFWQAMGFVCEAVTQGGVRRMRDINHWVLNIQPQLFFFETEPSDKKKDASFWRKRGDLSGNSAHRGKALKQYRDQIIKKDPQ
jgi:N-acetylglutamate synthase-like GNAT family acetyltransferase